MVALRRLFLRVAATLRAGRAEADLAREIDAHLQLLEDQFRAQGLPAEDARFASRRAFGGVEQAKTRQREARSVRWLDNSLLDIKLGAWMLVKYPGLTLVGVAGMTVVTALAAVAFSVGAMLLDPVVPLDEGERLVALEYWDPVAGNEERRVLHDFITWRDTLQSVVDIGAFRQVSRNLIVRGTVSETVGVVEITASGFRTARVPPLLGRPLLDSDEQPSATPAVVIGYDVWQRRFGGDSHVLGTTLQLGGTVHTIVGVMPERFSFPLNDNMWVPFQLDPSHYERRKSPGISVLARLAPGATRDHAQAELETLATRTAAAFPTTHAQLRPQVVPYTYAFSDMDDPENAASLRAIQLMVVLLLIVVCANVAVLVYARTATRQGEIAVRSALGASRQRIIIQLFLEAFVLSAVAAAAGLGLAVLTLGQANAAIVTLAGRLPFWMDLSLSPNAVVYVAALMILSAAVIGAIPAVTATGRRAQRPLQSSSRSVDSGMQLGRTWTVLIIAQVMFTVGLLPPSIFNAWIFVHAGMADPGAAAKEVLTAEVVSEDAGTRDRNVESEREFTVRYAKHHAELMRRLNDEAGVARATFSLQVPGEERTSVIEIEDTAGRVEGRGQTVRFNRVDIGFFDALGVPVLRGRALNAGDVGPTATAVVVNRSFAGELLGGSEVIGRRIRYVRRSGDVEPDHVELDRWYEIVGVVGDFLPVSSTATSVRAKLYHAVAAGGIYPAKVALRMGASTPADFVPLLRQIAGDVDPSLQLRNVLTVDEVLRQEQGMNRLMAAAISVVALSVVALSAAGIYALMSFAVTRRRKEIGIRTALGAQPHRILKSVFARAFFQLALGIALGLAVAVLLEKLTGGDAMNGNGIVLLPLVAALMTLVGLGAAAGPAYSGLRTDPADTLRNE